MLCDKVDLYGIVTETEAYVYEVTNDKDTQSSAPIVWADALHLLGVEDIAFTMLRMSTTRESVHKPLPPGYAVPFARRLQAFKERHIGNTTVGLIGASPYRNKSCVVMGAAPFLKGRNLGKWVDSHDSVWRCNHHVPDPTDKAVTVDHGARTDVIVTSSEMMYDPEVATVLKKATDKGAMVMAYPARERPPDTPPLFGLQYGEDYTFLDYKLQGVVHEWLKDLSYSGQHSGWFFHSTGHLAVQMALFMCGKVSATGFGLGRLTLFHHGFALEAVLLVCPACLVTSVSLYLWVLTASSLSLCGSYSDIALCMCLCDLSLWR